jgi:hypothetical protein
MPRYLVERTFQEGVALPGPSEGIQARLDFLANNTQSNVTWVHSYISPNNRKSYCIYDAPTPEAVRWASQRNGLPIDRITEVSVLDPDFY